MLLLTFCGFFVSMMTCLVPDSQYGGSSGSVKLSHWLSTRYASLAQAPKSIALQPLLQNGRYGFSVL